MTVDSTLLNNDIFYGEEGGGNGQLDARIDGVLQPIYGPSSWHMGAVVRLLCEDRKTALALQEELSVVVESNEVPSVLDVVVEDEVTGDWAKQFSAELCSAIDAATTAAEQMAVLKEQMGKVRLALSESCAPAWIVGAVLRSLTAGDSFR